MKKQLIISLTLLLTLNHQAYPAQPLDENQQSNPAPETVSAPKRTKKTVHFYHNPEPVTLEHQDANVRNLNEDERNEKLRAINRISRPEVVEEACAVNPSPVEIEISADSQRKLRMFQLLSKRPNFFRSQSLNKDGTLNLQVVTTFLTPERSGQETQAIINHALETVQERNTPAWKTFFEKSQHNNEVMYLFIQMLELELFEEAILNYLKDHNDIFPFYINKPIAIPHFLPIGTASAANSQDDENDDQ